MDAERRAAERAVRAHPHDPASARALAEALRRSGDRRALFHALCALARAGDPEASAEVEAWHPWPGPDGRGNRRAGVGRPVRDPVRTRAARLPVGVPRAIAGASSTHLFVVCAPPGWTPQGDVPGEVLVAVDLATLEVAWRVESEIARGAWERPALLVGEEVVWGTGDAVRVLSARGGAERFRLALGLGAAADGHALHADGDHLAVHAITDQRQLQALVAIDLHREASRWERRGGVYKSVVAAFDGALFMRDRSEIRQSDGAGPDPDWEPRRLQHVVRLGRGDRVLLHRASSGHTLARVTGVGPPAWSFEVPGAFAPDPLAVVGDVLVADTTLEEWHAHDVNTGALRWRRSSGPGLSPEGALVARSVVGAGGDVALLSAGPSRSRLLGLDESQGTTLDQTLDLPLLVRPPFRDIARVDFAELVALDGALLVVATGDEGDLVIASVENA